jgi:hypothetical protein
MDIDLERKLLGLLETIDEKLAKLLDGKPEAGPAFLSPEELATRLHRKPYTVREWCRMRRIACEKDEFTGRLSIPVAEYERLKNGGRLLPPQDPKNTAV